MNHTKSLFKLLKNYFHAPFNLFFLFLFLSLTTQTAIAEQLPGCYLFSSPNKIKYFKAQSQKSFFTCLGYIHGGQYP